MSSLLTGYNLLHYSVSVRVARISVACFSSSCTAILCASSPNVPFMADESAQAVPGLERLNYSLKQYMAYATELQQKARQLSRMGQLVGGFTMSYGFYSVFLCHA